MNTQHKPGALAILVGSHHSEKNDGIICELVKYLPLGSKLEGWQQAEEPAWLVKSLSRPFTIVLVGAVAPHKHDMESLCRQSRLKIIGGPHIDLTEDTNIDLTQEENQHEPLSNL